jgi:phage terminase large subunit-like protein
MALIKQELDEWLDQVSYEHLNSTDYIPSELALEFMNFIKLVNGNEGEANKTPPMHLAMMDKLADPVSYLVNLCFRGAAKTTVFGEYFFPFLAFREELPHLGKVEGAIYISDSMENGVKSLRKNLEHRYEQSDFLKEWMEIEFTDPYIVFKNKNGHKLGLRLFGAKTGLRGTKIFGKRPTVAVLDDLIGDGDANSQASMQAIRNTVYRGLNPALDPTKRKVIFNGTPFNKQDIIISAVESGVWNVNVWPVCEKFPCSEEEFRGAWPDRFTHEKLMEQYELAVGNGEVAAFMQEFMLRITSEEERLVQEGEIQYYDRGNLLRNEGNFNFYITTDFATSEKQSADYSVISVWAYSANGDWFWVDGVCQRMTMDKSVDHLFRLVSQYHPQQVGVEITGQQGGFIQWLQREMIIRNIWFNFASSAKSGEPGIRPLVSKLARFNLVVPWFKAKKFYWPEEMKASEIMGMFLGQIRLATFSALKGKDDCIDTISQLAYLNPWKPSESAPATPHELSVWDRARMDSESAALSSYIV